MNDSIWEQTCAHLFTEYCIPDSWRELNVASAIVARDRLRSFLRRTQDDPVVGGSPERLALDVYLYFLAFSERITRFILDKDSDPYLLALRDKFCVLEVAPYLRLCADMYCFSAISRCFDEQGAVLFSEARLRMVGAGTIGGLSKTHLEEWLALCELAVDQPQFISQMNLRTYQQAATVLDLPQDPENLALATSSSKWHPITFVAFRVSEYHVECIRNAPFRHSVLALLQG